MIRFLIGCIFCLCGPIALAEVAPHDCVGIEGDIERLQCFDQAFAVQEEVGQNVQATQPESDLGEWTVKVETSPIDDSKNVFMSLESIEPIRSRFGSPGPMVLNLMCRENTTDLSIYFNGLHMSDYQYGQVTYRIDKQKAKTRKFRESTSHEHLGLWGGRVSIPFIKYLIGADQLLIEATPYGENNVIAKFDIEGLDQAIKPLREACNW